MIKKFLILALTFFIVLFVISFYTKSKEKITAEQQPSPSKYLCDAHSQCEHDIKQIPKGVCVPGGACTAS